MTENCTLHCYKNYGVMNAQAASMMYLVQQTYSEGEHGKDINSKDKQNYEAVIRMTSKIVMDLVQDIPDGMGTHTYLHVMKSVLSGYRFRDFGAC